MREKEDLLFRMRLKQLILDKLFESLEEEDDENINLSTKDLVKSTRELEESIREYSRKKDVQEEFED